MNVWTWCFIPTSSRHKFRIDTERPTPDLSAMRSRSIWFIALIMATMARPVAAEVSMFSQMETGLILFLSNFLINCRRYFNLINDLLGYRVFRGRLRTGDGRGETGKREGVRGPSPSGDPGGH